MEMTEPFIKSHSLTFPSQGMAHLSIGLAILSMAMTFFICYCMWIHHGCRAFMPYISDLGLHGGMSTIFVAGLIVTSIFMLCALPQIFLARRRLLSALQMHAHWQKINVVLGLAGVATACGVGLLGFFPWDRILFWHLACADIIFGGGIMWAIGSWVLARRFASASHGAAMPQTWESCRRLRRLQCPVMVACFLVLLDAVVCFTGAYHSEPGIFSQGGLEKSLHLARNEFNHYCSGRLGWHGNVWINFAALSEWLYVFLLVTGVILSAADLEADRIVQRDQASLSPMIRVDDHIAWWRFW